MEFIIQRREFKKLNRKSLLFTFKEELWGKCKSVIR